MAWFALDDGFDTHPKVRKAGNAAVGLFALLVPFADAAHPFWVGLGALAFELVVALVVTSLLRRHLSRRTWKGIHWLAYAAWPLALIHGIGMGSDAARPWMVAVDVACLASFGAALTWRLWDVPGPEPYPAPAVARASASNRACRSASRIRSIS